MSCSQSNVASRIKADKAEHVRDLKREATEAKSALMRIQQHLLNVGAARDARSLGTVIARLEEWQNK